MAKKVAKEVKVSEQVAAFFKQNPKAASVVMVGDQAFLGSYYGAAKEYAERTGQKLEEIKNPNLATTDSEETEVVEATNEA
jgi:hypothetical protein